MLTKTKLAIAAAVLAASASGALAQGLIGTGVPGERAQRVGPPYSVPHHRAAPPRQSAGQTHANDIPFVPF
jgi:hypothetical protein